MRAAVCACSSRLWGWRWRGQPVRCWQPAPGSPSMCLAQTWHIPGVDLPRTPARPAWPPVPGPAAGRGGSAVPQPEPGHRPPAASPPPPRGQSRHQPQPQPPAIFRLTTAGPQLRHTRAAAVSDLDPDHASGSPDRDRDRLPCSARAAVPDAVGEQLAHHQRGAILARVPRPGHPGRERAGNPGLLSPAAVTLSGATALATSGPALPGPPRGPGNHLGPQPGTRGCTPGSAARVKPGTRRRRGPSVAVRKTADGAHRP